MADKEYLLGNKARELLKFTKQTTKIISDDVSIKDVRTIIKRIAQLDDIRDVKTVCFDIVGRLDKKKKDGFTKADYRLYGEDMREIARGIVRDVHSANNKHFQTEYEERLDKIDDVLDGCSLLMEYVQLCVDDKIISVKKGGEWTAKIQDVKRMSGSWKKNDSGRAAKIREETRAAAERRQFDLTRSAVASVIRGDQRPVR